MGQSILTPNWAEGLERWADVVGIFGGGRFRTKCLRLTGVRGSLDAPFGAWGCTDVSFLGGGHGCTGGWS